MLNLLRLPWKHGVPRWHAAAFALAALLQACTSPTATGPGPDPIAPPAPPPAAAPAAPAEAQETASQSELPVTPPAPRRVPVVAVAAGGFHNLALKEDGSVTQWGSQSDCEVSMSSGGFVMPDGSVVVAKSLPENGPVPVPAGLTDVVALATGSCADGEGAPASLRPATGQVLWTSSSSSRTRGSTAANW